MPRYFSQVRFQKNSKLPTLFSSYFHLIFILFSSYFHLIFILFSLEFPIFFLHANVIPNYHPLSLQYHLQFKFPILFSVFFPKPTLKINPILLYILISTIILSLLNIIPNLILKLILSLFQIFFSF